MKAKRKTPARKKRAGTSAALAVPEPIAQLGRQAAAQTREALGRVNALETLEAAYDAWLTLKLEHALFLADCARERRRLAEEGAFLVGTVREAGTGAALDAFLGKAEGKLGQARAALEKEFERAEAGYAAAFEQIGGTVLDRVKRYAEKARPRLKLIRLPAGPNRSILHVARPGPDEAVLVLWALSGRVPSRHGFLFDDATDALELPPAALYPDEGVKPSEVRPAAPAVKALLEARPEIWPVKAWIPVLVPVPGGTELFRMLERGPVMEVELMDGQGFRNVLSHDEGQRFAGHLLRQKIEGRIELEVEAG